MTTSLGPRYALVGPLMSNAFGGGGGSSGFRHMLEHIVPAMQGWLKDMYAHQVQYDEATYEKLEKSVAEELDKFDMKEVEDQRDELTIQLLKSKKAASALV